MLGQGSPNRSPQPPAQRKAPAPPWRLRAVLFGLALCVFATHNALWAEDAVVRLRIAWGGGAERTWQGRIALSKGSLADPMPLGWDADEPGSMWLSASPVEIAPGSTDRSFRRAAFQASGDHLEIRSPSARGYDAVDIAVSAPSDASLWVQWDGVGAARAVDPAKPDAARADAARADLARADAARGEGQSGGPWIEVRLADALRGEVRHDLDDTGNRLVVARNMADELRVKFEPRPLVFAPGQTFRFEVEPNFPVKEAGATMQLRVRRLGARGGPEQWAEERPLAAGRTAPIAIEVPVGNEEGVFDVELTAALTGRSRWSNAVRSPLSMRGAEAQRTIQILVLQAKPRAADGRSDPLAVVEEIDPANPKWWMKFTKLAQLPRFQRLWRGPLGNDRISFSRHALGPVAQLAPSPRPGDASWEAYTLPLARPGMPHVLEIDYPSDVPQTLGISVVEPNNSGAVVSTILETGVDRAENVVETGEKPRWLSHRVVFWPRTKSPVVLVTNRQPGRPAVYGRIRLLAGWRHLPRAFPASSPAPQRMLAAYLDRPWFARQFSATDAAGGGPDVAIDDWQTFYEGGTRLVEYLHYVGYTGLVLSVYSDASTIYPSAVLQPTPQYDTGGLARAGQDPVRKDGLEMLLRLFGRESLQLIPALDFATPLPELEDALRRGGREAEGIVWVGPEGLSRRQTHRSVYGRAPYYNPLHPRVQAAMRAVVRELVARYASQPALAGVAVQLSAQGYAQLLPPDWGLDDATIGEFERETKIRLPGEGPDRFAARAEALRQSLADGTVEWRREWLQWRAARMARFYRDLQAELNGAKPGLRLVLVGGDMFGGETWAAALRPALPSRSSSADLLLQAGVDLREFASNPSIVFLRSERFQPDWALARRAVDLEWTGTADFDRAFAQMATPGALFFHATEQSRLFSFEEKFPFRPCQARFASQPAPSAWQNRRRFVHGLATLDAQMFVDGGWMLPLGQEESLAELVAIYRQLPAVRFRPATGGAAAGAAPASLGQSGDAALAPPEKPGQSGPSGQPLVVRWATVDQRAYAYMLNDAPFPVVARVRVDAPAECRLRSLGASRSAGAMRQDDEGVYWECELAPYDIVAVTFSAPNVQLTQPQATWAPQIQSQIDRAVSMLNQRAGALRSPPALAVLPNPDFNRPAGNSGKLPGWTLLGKDGIAVTLDRAIKYEGSASACLSSEGTPGALVSPYFTCPETGRLALSFWLRVADPARQPPLRVTVERQQGGQIFQSSARFGQPVADTPNPAAIREAWSQFVVHIDDLPLGGAARLRLKLELTGRGEVWIDDIQLTDLAFSKRERIELVRLIAPASVQLQNGQIGDCLQLLDSYWPRFLLENVAAPAAVASRTDAAPPPAPKDSEPPASLMDRVRSMVPSRLRWQ